MGESQKGMAKSELVDLGEEKSPRIDREKIGALAALHRHRHEKTTTGNAHLPKTHEENNRWSSSKNYRVRFRYIPREWCRRSCSKRSRAARKGMTRSGQKKRRLRRMTCSLLRLLMMIERPKEGSPRREYLPFYTWSDDAIWCLIDCRSYKYDLGSIVSEFKNRWREKERERKRLRVKGQRDTNRMNEWNDKKKKGRERAEKWRWDGAEA